MSGKQVGEPFELAQRSDEKQDWIIGGKRRLFAGDGRSGGGPPVGVDTLVMDSQFAGICSRLNSFVSKEPRDGEQLCRMMERSLNIEVIPICAGSSRYRGKMDSKVGMMIGIPAVQGCHQWNTELA